MDGRSAAGRRFELTIIGVALVAVVFRASQWRFGLPDLNVVAIVALLLVPLAVRAQVTISRGEVDLSLGGIAAVLFAADLEQKSTILPIWAVLVAVGYVIFRRDEGWGQFRVATQVLGGAALMRAAQITDIGFGPFDRVLVGLAVYFAVITALELLRRVVAPAPDEGRALRLRWTWAFLVGLGIIYSGCVIAVLRRAEMGQDLPVVASLVVTLVAAVGVIAALALRASELNRSVAALSGAAIAMPWRRDEIDDTLAYWGAHGLRVETVDVRPAPGARWDLSVPLPDGRFVVADRRPGDLPFTQVETDVLQALVHMSDTSRRESEHLEALERRANTDGLTGLANYTFFREVLDDVSENRRAGESIGIVFIDLDGFKEINDRYGHIAGDAALRVLGDRLLRHTGDQLSVTRYGGDEFAVMVRDVDDYAALTTECGRLRWLVTEPIVIGEHTLRLRASFGAALSTSPDDSMEDVVRAADQQMYQRKRAVHEGDGPATTRIDEAVRRAIVDRTLSTAYQPIVNLVEGAVQGMEVLVRHTDPVLGSIPPPIIVAAAIRLNMLDDLTMQVLDQAIATLRECRATRPEIGIFSINLELEQMATWTPLIEQVAQCHELHGIRIAVEISERSIGRWSDAHAQVTRKLQARGVLIAIDDFGSGSAGLGSLFLPEVDIVKLDRNLLTDLDNPRQTLVVTRATSLMRELGYWTVAEGVTHQREADILLAAGTTHVQGYLYGVPGDRRATVDRLRRFGVASIAQSA
ncbi:MAG: hypothetical protein JWP31_1011 [Aeromicrobium sp.]|nr:hypothetical protein [Aeromicrobium sp.]